MEAQKPARLDALTGLRCFAALNIVFFHFSNPDWFGPLSPVVNAGYLSVSFFIMLSGFVLAYNYAGRARLNKDDPHRLSKVRFWKARITRLYPVYLLSLVLGFQTFLGERAAHTTHMFWLGTFLTPLLLQGWIPEIATFGNTPAWTMSAEAAYYAIFPWIAALKPPPRLAGHLWRLGVLWLLGMIPGTLYVIFNPDGTSYPYPSTAVVPPTIFVQSLSDTAPSSPILANPTSVNNYYDVIFSDAGNSYVNRP